MLLKHWKDNKERNIISLTVTVVPWMQLLKSLNFQGASTNMPTTTTTTNNIDLLTLIQNRKGQQKYRGSESKIERNSISD